MTETTLLSLVSIITAGFAVTIGGIAFRPRDLL